METRERDLERLIPMHKSGEVVLSVPPSPLASPIHVAGRESASYLCVKLFDVLYVQNKQAVYKVIRSWASKKFMTGCVILLPIAVTFYFTWWFIHFVDGFFSPIYTHLGINMFGLGFVTSITFIFVVGVFMSSWLGASFLSIGECSGAFKEVAIIRHPHRGEYAFGFITSTVILRGRAGGEELCCVYVPTNHLYLGDIFLISSKDIIRPNLSVREGIEIVISGGMSIPEILTTLDAETIHRTVAGSFAIPQV
ncbi:hypothetical protein IGI04_024160 [Brassica rapa subsp. trilocularis]|uniref:Uncharacterized protein n=2 Tax=Brassica TaxID=3705 RepID=A0ABQ8D1D3_BRANA|nr:hypothetical protein IGI04_024160 [Brassica rapa subsp. trilocularis]KAH0923174.1 hypothetical protein HID58_023192 [Brassica napus]